MTENPGWLVVDRVEGVLDWSSNVTLRITIPDTHYAPCEKGSTFDNEYCMNGGDCALWININTHFCKCHHPFVGSRCEILDPGISQNPEGEPVSIPFTVTIMLGALLFLTLICGVAYIRYKSSVWRERTKQLEKALKHLNVNGRYPIPTSRRESPVGGVLMYKANSQIPNTDGTEHVLLDIKDRDACNNSSRHGSLASNQYRLLASEDKQATAPVETPVTSHRASINSIETQLPNKQSHSSIV